MVDRDDRATNSLLRAQRKNRGLTQEELAQELVVLAREAQGLELGLNAGMISKWERGEKRPGPLYRSLLCTFYDESPEALGLRNGGGARRINPKLEEAPPSELAEIAERARWMAITNVSDPDLSELDRLVAAVGARYEESDAASVYPAVLQQRRRLDDLLRGHQYPRHRERLYLAAGQLSGLLGYLAFDLGRQPIARAYCQEALQLAALSGYDDLTAWVRGTESFLAYYAGRYREALELARDGQRYARGGPQSIRLAASGEARALGRLGDRNGVDEAVNRALAGAGEDPQQERAGCFLSFEPMTAPRLAGNAASAYLSLGQPKRVQEFAGRALRTFAVAPEARASHALTLVDVSLSHLMGSSPELEGAAAAMAEAVVAGSRLRSHVVARRAGDFLVSSEPWRAARPVAEVAEAVRQWQAAAS